MGSCNRLASIVGVQLAPNTQLKAEDPVRKLEEELRLVKDLRLSMTAGFGASKQSAEQDIKLKTLA